LGSGWRGVGERPLLSSGRHVTFPGAAGFLSRSVQTINIIQCLTAPRKRHGIHPNLSLQVADLPDTTEHAERLALEKLADCLPGRAGAVQALFVQFRDLELQAARLNRSKING
jgi:hypothetical protein